MDRDFPLPVPATTWYDSLPAASDLVAAGEHWDAVRLAEPRAGEVLRRMRGLTLDPGPVVHDVRRGFHYWLVPVDSCDFWEPPCGVRVLGAGAFIVTPGKSGLDEMASTCWAGPPNPTGPLAPARILCATIDAIVADAERHPLGAPPRQRSIRHETRGEKP